MKKVWMFFGFFSALNGVVAQSVRVVDTDFSKGRKANFQEVSLDDLSVFHGHQCDGLGLGFRAMSMALDSLYSEGIADRTNTRVVSRSSPCLADAAIYLSGARFQYNTFYVDDQMPYIFVVQRVDNGKTVAVSLLPGAKPAEIDSLGTLANQQLLDPCTLDHLRNLEDAWLGLVMDSDLNTLFSLEKLESWEWKPILRSEYPKTDILNKDLAPCESRSAPAQP